MEIGEILLGKVVAIKPYGAFIEFSDGQSGLIHISEIKSGFVDNIFELLSVNQIVKVQVIDFDEYSKKASLSLRSMEQGNDVIYHNHRFSNRKLKIGFEPLEKSLPKWIEESLLFLKENNY